MPLTLSVLAMTLGAGGLIGLVLGLVGGGAAILAVPLLVYAVGMPSVHAAIGTAAIAVAVNAATSLAGHARAGTVKWPCGLVFAAAGVAGAAAGAELGKSVDSAPLLLAFGVLMIGVGGLMLRPRRGVPRPEVHLDRTSAARLLPRLVPIGLGVGLLAGFFGIGGGFLIVPGLILATAMPLANAIGTSLVGVTALGLTTAASYALSGDVDWRIAGVLIAGGLAGGVLGLAIGRRLAARKRLLEIGFALVVIAIGTIIALRGA
ncbi:sulfite exporter TauE/SafE family protein [Zavarzinia sp. CC-PAN008]|uniref:sulfite exporter TauE/SafE family protein n=1 Tax=Zavarzinia sp. CC-PAN008 TaxID=3243332 RepID=UPI003F7490D1